MSDETAPPRAPRARRTAADRLRAALAELHAHHGEVLMHTEKAWASITFAGTRHSLTILFAREEAVEAGDRLARFLIENSISAQSTDFDPPEECDCPRCGKPAKRKDEAPDTRELETKPGGIAFKRQAYYCAPCRRIFFPNGLRTRSEG